MRGLCDVDGCERPRAGRGLCDRHYRSWKRTGEPVPLREPYMPKRPVEERFWEKVDKTDTCWLWTGLKNGNGYGLIHSSRRSRLAHRFAYELLVGPIPDGLTIDHLCRVRHCVNPAHMEPVTRAVNTLRGIGPAAIHAAKTHCKHGHEFTPENTYVYIDKRGRRGRRCIACQQADAKARWQRELKRRRANANPGLNIDVTATA